MAQDYFQILEIAETAPPDEIKRAYFKMVRRHPPEKDPEQFKLIRLAYDTLMDPRARQDYIAMLHHGGEIAKLYAEAHEYMEKESFPQAIRALKKILALAPGEHSAGDYLGLCYLHMNDFIHALNIYESLARKAPDVPLYWYHYGVAYHKQGKTLPETDRSRARMFEEARTKFRKAIELESLNQIPYQAIAQTYMDESNYYQAEIWIEKAIGADNKVNFDDLDSLFQLCMIYLLSDRIQRISEITKRIMSFVPENQDARQYVAYRFVEYARLMCDNELFDQALEFINAALKFDPANTDLKKWQKGIRNITNVDHQYRKLKNDASVIEPLHRLIALYYCDFWGQSKDSSHQRDVIFKDIMSQFDQFTPQQILSSLTRLKSQYRALYDLNRSFFRKFDDIVQQQMTQTTHTVPHRSPTTLQSGNTGSCFIVTAVFETPHHPVVEQYRHYRDAVLIRSPVGRTVIRIYQRVGPIGASILNRIPILKKPTAWLLKRAARWLPIY